LQFVAREMGDAPLLVVGTYREIEARDDAAKAEALGALGREVLHERLALRGLSAEESTALLAAVAGRAPGDRLAQALYERTEGNPFFLVEVARHLDEHGLFSADANAGVAARAPAVPETIRAVVRQRLRRLRPQTLRLLDAAAVVGRDFELAVLASILDCDEAAMLPLLAEAAAAGLVQPLAPVVTEGRFAHALVRDALYDALPADARAAAHRHTAHVLTRHWQLEQNDHAGELALHFLASATEDDVRRAVDLAVCAAERAAADVAYEDAVDWYRLALEALARVQPPDAERTCRLLLALGGAQAAVSDMTEMRATFRRAAELARRCGDAGALAQAAVGFSRVPVLEGSVDTETVALLEEALVALPPGDASLRANALSMLAYALQHAPGLQDRRAALCREAGDMARRLSDLRTLARTFYDQHSALFAPETLDVRLAAADELLDLARRTDDRPMLLRARYCRVIDLIELGRLPEADAEIDALSRLAAELREPWHHWYASWFRAARALMDGRFDAGEQLAHEAWAHGERVAPELALQVLGVQISMLRALQGRWGEMIPAIRTLVEQFPAVAAWRCALAKHAVELGLEEEARRHFAIVARDDFASIPRDGSWFIAVSQLVDVCARLHDAERAASLYALLLPYADRLMIVNSALSCSGAGSHFLGVLARTMGRFAEAATHLQHALAIHRRLGLRPWVALTQLEIVRLALERDGMVESEEARAALAEAATLAASLGMAGVAADVQALGAGASEAEDAPAAAEPAESRAPGNVFRKDGEFWTAAFAGEVCRLKDSLGLRYLVQLLRHPGTEIHVTELLSLAAGTPAATPAATVPAGLAVRTQSDALPGLDREAQRAYRARLLELREDLEQAERDNDPGAAARARAEMEMLARELTGAVRSDAGERARASVTKRVKSALARLRAAHPALGRHLEVTVKTGYFCRYTPDPRHPIDWHT
jgi:tetratricopeptide (TPR) repeat protein